MSRRAAGLRAERRAIHRVLRRLKKPETGENSRAEALPEEATRGLEGAGSEPETGEVGKRARADRLYAAAPASAAPPPSPPPRFRR